MRALRSSAQASKLLVSRTVKFIKRMQAVTLADGFSQLVHFKRSFNERLRERKEHGQQSIQLALKKLLRNRLSDAFLSLKMRGYRKKFKEEFLARTFKHAALYRTRHFFGKWKHQSDLIGIAEQVNVS